MARPKDDRKSFTYWLGIVNFIVVLAWTAVFLVTDWLISKDGTSSLTSPSSMLIYVITFFTVALGAAILPSLEKSTGKKGVVFGMSLSWFAALLYGGMAAAHFLKYDDVIRNAIMPK